MDTIYEQRAFAETYLQTLVSRTGSFKDVDAVVSRGSSYASSHHLLMKYPRSLQSELTAQLLTLPLALLRHRFPHLFPHPPLLAHAVYQSVVFDDSIRRGGFAVSRTWKAMRQRQVRGTNIEDGDEEWEGMTEEILNTDDWFERWWQGEKECEYRLIAGEDERPN